MPLRRRRPIARIATTAVVAGTAANMGARSAQRSAAAAQPQAAPPEPAPAYEPAAPEAAAPEAINSDQIEVLKQLAALKDQGILTEEEFAAKKAQILGLRPTGFDARPGRVIHGRSSRNLITREAGSREPASFGSGGKWGYGFRVRRSRGREAAGVAGVARRRDPACRLRSGPRRHSRVAGVRRLAGPLAARLPVRQASPGFGPDLRKRGVRSRAPRTGDRPVASGLRASSGQRQSAFHDPVGDVADPRVAA
jgi:hypothetical protein